MAKRAFLLLIGLSYSAEIEDCPFQCVCEEAQGQSVTNCANAQIRSASELTIPTSTTHLNLSNNLIADLGGFDGLRDLQMLDLSGNLVEEVRDGAFKDLPKLKVVNLARNERLRLLDDYSFFSLPALEFVSLANCKSLAWISYRTFYDSYEVQQLDLSGTNVTSLQQNLLLYSPNIRSINVGRAPIRCDCVNEWMATSPGRAEIVGLDCADFSAIPCLPRIIDIYPNATATATVGESFTLKCVGVGHPVFKTYMFNKNGTKIGHNGKFKILDVRPKDAGIYTCKTMNKYGITSKTFNLNVATAAAEGIEITDLNESLPIYANGDEVIEFEIDQQDSEFDEQDEYDSETVDIGDAFTLPAFIPLDNESTEVTPVEVVTAVYHAEDVDEIVAEGVDESEVDREIRFNSNVYEWRTKSCPANCTCTINDFREKKVECDSVDLTAKGQSLPSDLTMLVVRDSTFDLQRFQIMRQYVKKLEIVDSEYNSLSNVDFDRFFDLDELTIAGTGLTEISEDAFEDIVRLRSLDLSNNELKKIPAQIFANLTRLEQLVLENNPLGTLDPATFRHMPNLKTLNLIATDIEQFEPELIANNSRLMTLWLDRNQLVEMPDFSNHAQLAFVRLSANPIEFIKHHDFYQLANLEGIYADEMPFLVSIEPQAFADLPSLIDVSISACKKLSFVHPDAFHNCPNLRTLNLAGNALFTLGDMRPSVPSITLVSLEQNRVFCDCSVSWLLDLEYSSNVNCSTSVGGDGPIALQAIAPESLERCSPRLHVPRLRSDDSIYAYEDEPVRFGCFSTTSAQVRISGPAGAFDRDVINFSATRDNIGKYLCEDMDNGLTKEIRVRLIGDNEETEDAEIETESSATTANLTVMLVMIGWTLLV